MRRMMKLGILFLFMLFLAVPVFAQEDIDELGMSDEEMGMTEAMDEGVITGKVTSVGAGTVTVKTEDGVESTFSVVDGETILWKGIEDIELSDVSVGDEAEVGYYTDEAGNLIASWVDVLVEEGIGPEEEAAPLEELTGPEEEGSSVAPRTE